MKPETVRVAEAAPSQAQVRRWQQLDPLIRRAEQDGFEADCWLHEVSRDKLYRAGGFKTFEAYLNALGIPHSTGYDRVTVGKVMELVRTSDKAWVPRNRHQAMQLTGLEDPILFRVCELAKKREEESRKPLTAEQLGEIVEEATGRPPGALPGEVSDEVAEAVASGAIPIEAQLDLLAPAGEQPEEEDEDAAETEAPPRPELPKGNTRLHRQARWLGGELDRLRREAEGQGDWLVRLVERFLDALTRATLKKLAKEKGTDDRAA